MAIESPMRVEDMQALSPSVEAVVENSVPPLPYDISLLENEHNKRFTVLNPLKRVILKGRDETPLAIKTLNYISATRNIETTSDRVIELQKYVDLMTKDTIAQGAKVVIMQRGVEPEAFVVPDGTIFINQALINTLSSIDEIGGVLAHEVGHLINKTAEEKYVDDAPGKFGVGWVHEMGSDALTLSLLEKATLRSTGLATAIQKIGLERGTIHQGGNMRATQIMGLHTAYHTATSNLGETPIPDSWRTEIVRPTNMEILISYENYHKHEHEEKIPENEWKTTPEVARAILENLYVADMQDVASGFTIHDEPYASAFVAVATERLLRSRYTPVEIQYFLISVFSRSHIQLIHSPEELVALARGLPAVESSKRVQEMHQIIFDEPMKNTATDALAQLFRGNFFIEGKETKEFGIPVTEITFIQALAAINQSPIDYKGFINVINQQIINDYIDKAYLYPARDENLPLDIEGVRKFLEAMHQAGIPFSKAEFKQKHYSKSEKHLYRQIEREIQKVFDPNEPTIDQKIKEAFEDDHNNFTIKEIFAELTEYFEENDMDEEQRLPYIDGILNRWDLFAVGRSIPSSVTTSIRAYLQGKVNRRESSQTGVENTKIARFTLKLLTVIALYPKDSDGFYDKIASLMDTSGIDPKKLSRLQLVNLCVPLLNQDSDSGRYDLSYPVYGFGKPMLTFTAPAHIKNYERLMKLPFIAEMTSEGKRPEIPTNIEDLLHYTQHLTHTIKNFFQSGSHGIYYSNNMKYPLFSDIPGVMIACEGIQEAFDAIIAKGVESDEAEYLFSFIEEFLPDDTTKTRALHQLGMQALDNKPNLYAKILFLKEHASTLHFEGLLHVADQITTMEEYEILRAAMKDKIQEYLSTNKETTVAAGVDLVSSELTEHYDKLLETCLVDLASSERVSTELAKKWVLITFFTRTQEYPNMYDATENGFVLASGNKHIFRSYADIASSLEALSPLQRVLLAVKALEDSKGAFASLEDRQKLADFALQGLQLEDGFIAHVIQKACLVANPAIVGYPLSSLFGPLLFRNVSPENVNIEELLNTEDYIMRDGDENYTKTQLRQLISREALEKILRAPTRDIVAFGKRYKDQQNSYFYPLAQRNKTTFFSLYQHLEERFPENATVEKTPETKLDDSIEALIQGVQASGAVGVRALQLARQLMNFSPEVNARLSETFDSNPGLDKLRFWENLCSFKEKAAKDQRYVQPGHFVRDQLVSVGQKLGGGSLYTTYAAVVKDKEGHEREAALKILNPNAPLMIESFYKLALDTLEEVKKSGNPDDIANAQKALMLIELAQQWCLTDINDTHFEEDDDTFHHQVIEGFNARQTNVVFTSPERIETQYLIKCEDLARGQTMNAFLKSDVPKDQKKQVVQALVNFFDYQVSHDTPNVQGYYLHSDPHPGNYMIESVQGEQLRIAVLDRNYYLKLSSAEVRAIRHLWQGNQIGFFNSFVGSVLDANNFSKNLLQRTQFLASVALAVQRNTPRGADQLQQMQVLLDELGKRNLHIDLKMHLAIKNVASLQRLRAEWL